MNGSLARGPFFIEDEALLREAFVVFTNKKWVGGPRRGDIDVCLERST